VKVYDKDRCAASGIGNDTGSGCRAAMALGDGWFPRSSAQ